MHIKRGKPKQENGRQRDFLLALNRAAAAIQSASPSEKEIYQAFCHELASMGFFGAIGKLDRTRNKLTVLAVANHEKHLEALEGLTGIKDGDYVWEINNSNQLTRAINRGQPIFIHYTAENLPQLMLPAAARPYSAQLLANMKSLPGFIIPIKVNGNIWGVMNFAGEGLLEADTPAVMAFADHMSIAIEKAKLFENLRQMANKNEMLLNQAADGIFLADDNGHYVDVNPAGLEMIGYSRDELFTMKIQDLIIPDKQKNHPIDTDALHRGESIVYERRLRTKNGRPLPTEISAVKLKNGSLLGIVRDISQRKQKEAERTKFEQQEIKLKELLILLNRGEVEAGLNMILAHLCQSLGFKAGWVLLRGEEGIPYTLVASHNLEDELPIIESAFFTPDCPCIEALAKEKNTFKMRTTQCARFLHAGIKRHILNMPLVAESVIGMMDFLIPEDYQLTPSVKSVLENVSQTISLALANSYLWGNLQLANEALKIERQKLIGLLAGLPIGVLLLDQSQKLLMANIAAKECLPSLELVPPEMPLVQVGAVDISDILEDFQNLMPIEVKDPLRPGFISEIKARPIMVGDRKQWALVVQDVTIDREVKRQVQMQERLATVGRLAAGIAHDFNNIMAVIVLYSDLLQRRDDLPGNVQEQLKTIRDQGNRASVLIRQILDFSRQSVMTLRPLSLLPFLKEIKKMLERTLPETITTTVKYDGDKFVIRADPTQIQQVIMNLALNARDALDGGGEIQFILSHFTLNPRQSAPCVEMKPGEWVVLTVTDNGCGMSSDVQEHIFEPFFTTKKPGKGTGLGLAQVHGIIGQHGGSIRVYSKVGLGTTFSIYFPRLETKDGQQFTQTGNLHPGDSEVILVVEDNLVTRNAVSDILALMNYKVMTAANGEEALALFDRHHDEINLVLSDMVMPKMGGMALYDSLKARGMSVKMVLMSGYPLEPADRARLADDKMLWLQKPMKPKQLSQIIKRALAEDKT